MIPRLATACALALAAFAAQGAGGAVPGDVVSVEFPGPGRDTVRLVDAVTHATLAQDRIEGESMRDSFVVPDNTVIAVRHGAGDGDSLAVYPIAWSTDAAGAKSGKVAHVLSYRPRDGHLTVLLRPVPDGTVIRVESGRHPPYWNKVFLYRRASGTWYEWPRVLAPADPTEGVPSTVADTRQGIPYAAWLRPLDRHAD